MRVGSQSHDSAALLQGKKTGAHSTGGFVGPAKFLGVCGKFRSNRDSISISSYPQRVALPAHTCKIVENNLCSYYLKVNIQSTSSLRQVISLLFKIEAKKSWFSSVNAERQFTNTNHFKRNQKRRKLQYFTLFIPYYLHIFRLTLVRN